MNMKTSILLPHLLILTLGYVLAIIPAQGESHAADPNTSEVVRALNNKKIHIVQLGDSHTAADFLTDTVRTQLQQQLGNGGAGWAMPANFAGMRLARYSYQNHGWQTLSSRTQRNNDYTLGGLLAVPAPNAELIIRTRLPEKLQTVTASIRQGADDENLHITDASGQHIELAAPIKNNTWQLATFTAQFPLTVTAGHSPQTAIGGWWARNQNGEGAVYSALGINGAQLNYLTHWNTQAWQAELKQIAPDLVILAYGTNEVFNDRVDIAAARQMLTQTIHQIRALLPHSAVMLLGAPESLKNTQGLCGTRPARLTEFQNMQKSVAAEQHTLYWDWQAAMGGECSMKTWIAKGLGRSDGIHFSQAGYQQLGTDLANTILHLPGQVNCLPKVRQ